MEINFLSIDEILEIHRDQIDRYGGESSIRDMALLESAHAMPLAGFDGHYIHDDIFKMAAAYLYHIVQNHPFVDGNKRTGAVSALIFLAINDIDFDADEDEFAEIVLGVASGNMDKPAIADYLRRYSTIK